MTVSANYSTFIPGAIQSLYSYMQAVQVAQPAGLTDISVIFGTPTGSDKITENVLMFGAWREQGGNILTDYASNWFDLPAAAGRRLEPFNLNFSIMSWSGAIDPVPLNRIVNVFAMFNALIEQIMDDYPWPLLGPGSWGELSMDMPVAGPMATGGWGAVLECKLEVINAVVQGYPQGT